jgi:hypothetical protein
LLYNTGKSLENAGKKLAGIGTSAGSQFCQSGTAQLYDNGSLRTLLCKDIQGQELPDGGIIVAKREERKS